MDIQNIALAAGLAWASGLRLYVVLFLVGISGYCGWIQLPEHLEVLAHPLVLGTSGTLAVAEFFADKIPGFDSLWDAVHTFIRIPAGALLAAGANASEYWEKRLNANTRCSIYCAVPASTIRL